VRRHPRPLHLSERRLLLVRAITRSAVMLVGGLILFLLGYFLHVSILVTIGIILLIIGAVLLLVGALGHPVGGRRYWY
jgi:fatty acid desaturase